MSRYARVTILGGLSIFWWSTAPMAETMRCQSINGNVNCAGSGAISCQTVNGRKVCTSGNGAVVQSFGGGSSSTQSEQAGGQDAGADDEALDDEAPKPKGRVPLQKHGPAGHSMLLDRDENKSQRHTNRLPVERE